MPFRQCCIPATPLGHRMSCSPSPFIMQTSPLLSITHNPQPLAPKKAMGNGKRDPRSVSLHIRRRWHCKRLWLRISASESKVFRLECKCRHPGKSINKFKQFDNLLNGNPLFYSATCPKKSEVWFTTGRREMAAAFDCHWVRG